MQVTDSFSVPRRALDVEDFIDIARRHKNWILGPTFAALVVAVVTAYLWPDTFQSSAVIKVVPQQLPENFVQANFNQQMTDRITSMATSILSRSTLTQIIQTYGLYPRDRGRLPIEDVVENMRKKIAIGSVMAANNFGAPQQRGVSAFKIEFGYENRNLAQKVVADLVTRFVDENQRNRSSMTYNTNQFVKDQYDQARKELDEYENKLAAFRAGHLGRLPDERESNLQQLKMYENRLSAVNGSIGRIHQEKLLIETQLRISRDQLKNLREPQAEQVAVVQRNERVAELDREVANLESQLASLREHYQDTFPDVQRVIAMLRAAKANRDAALKTDVTKKPEAVRPPPTSPQFLKEQRDLENSVKQYTAQLEAKDLEIQQYNRELQDIEAKMKQIQGAISESPLGEREYTELVRERDMAKAKYSEWELKLNKSKDSQEMENRKQGETLEVLDPATLPQTPSEPKRPAVIGIGTVIGLILGVVVAGIREVKDTSLKNLKDVRAYTQLTVLGSIPLLENDIVVRRRRRLALLAWTVASVAAVAIMSGAVVYYYATKA